MDKEIKYRGATGDLDEMEKAEEKVHEAQAHQEVQYRGAKTETPDADAPKSTHTAHVQYRGAEDDIEVKD